MTTGSATRPGHARPARRASRPRALPAGLALALALGASIPTGCGAPGRRVAWSESRPLEAPHVFITYADYFEGGRRGVETFLAGLPPDERSACDAALERAAAACVRIEIVASRSGNTSRRVKGSGVLVAGEGGRPLIATAGHSLDAIDVYEGEVWLPDGRGLATRLAQVGDQRDGTNGDWALLALDGPLPPALPVLRLAEPVVGELVFLLGYPDGMGVGEDGHVAFRLPDDPGPLQPLVVVATVAGTSPLELTPVAGAATMGGASGGAIVDLRGDVVGLLALVSTESDSSGATYWMEGPPSESFREHVAAAAR